MVTKPSSTSAADSLVLSPALARVREVGLVLAGTVALTLIVGGYLILRRRRQEG